MEASQSHETLKKECFGHRERMQRPWDGSKASILKLTAIQVPGDRDFVWCGYGDVAVSGFTAYPKHQKLVPVISQSFNIYLWKKWSDKMAEGLEFREWERTVTMLQKEPGSENTGPWGPGKGFGIYTKGSGKLLQVFHQEETWSYLHLKRSFSLFNGNGEAWVETLPLWT